jgi:hypothetical protein
MLIADRLDAPWGSAKFGVAPRHVREIKNGVVTKYASGKIPRDMEFEWFGDKDNPPAWASPKCANGRAAYRKMAKRVLAKKSINQLKKVRYQTILDDLAKSETSEPEVSKESGGSSGSSGVSKRAEAIDRAVKGEVIEEKKPAASKKKDAPVKVAEEMLKSAPD